MVRALRWLAGRASAGTPFPWDSGRGNKWRCGGPGTGPRPPVATKLGAYRAVRVPPSTSKRMACEQRLVMADRSMAQARKDPIGRRMKIGGSQNKISSPDLRLPPKQIPNSAGCEPPQPKILAGRGRRIPTTSSSVRSLPALPPGCPATRSEAPRELGLESARWRPRGRAGPRWPPTRRSRRPFCIRRWPESTATRSQSSRRRSKSRTRFRKPKRKSRQDRSVSPPSRDRWVRHPAGARVAPLRVEAVKASVRARANLPCPKGGGRARGAPRGRITDLPSTSAGANAVYPLHGNSDTHFGIRNLQSRAARPAVRRSRPSSSSIGGRARPDVSRCRQFVTLEKLFINPNEPPHRSSSAVAAAFDLVGGAV